MSLISRCKTRSEQSWIAWHCQLWIAMKSAKKNSQVFSFLHQCTLLVPTSVQPCNHWQAKLLVLFSLDCFLKSLSIGRFLFPRHSALYVEGSWPIAHHISEQTVTGHPSAADTVRPNLKGVNWELCVEICSDRLSSEKDVAGASFRNQSTQFVGLLSNTPKRKSTQLPFSASWFTVKVLHYHEVSINTIKV